MTAAALIALLSKADPNAEVFGEFEGSIFPIEPDDVRTGIVQLANIGTREDGSIHKSWHSPGYPQGIYPVLRECPGVLLWPGESDSEWPDRLKDRP